MSDIVNQILNSTDLAPVLKPDNKNTFLLNEDECAFVNAINLHTCSLKTLLISIVSSIEEQTEKQMKVLEDLKDQFITALVQKHDIPFSKETLGAAEIDLPNKLLVIKPKEEVQPK
jgi:hypothetical protein